MTLHDPRGRKICIRDAAASRDWCCRREATADTSAANREFALATPALPAGCIHHCRQAAYTTGFSTAAARQRVSAGLLCTSLGTRWRSETKCSATMAAMRAAARLQNLTSQLTLSGADATGPLQHTPGTTVTRHSTSSTSTYVQASPLHANLSILPEVREALQQGKAVVALESTIISHGMPFPQNLETALEVEAVVRRNGAVPATIAILHGVPCIGCTHKQLERLARLGSSTHKVSRRDLPVVVGRRLDGSTTVSATAILAAMAGIQVFVTGGIGGVHRGAESTMDVSADLTELGRTAITVVCAGAKSILDIPKTLEYLETQGVCVAAYGTATFPAFFTPDSGCKAPHTVNTPREAAALIQAAQQLQLRSGLLVAVPIPRELAAAGRQVEAAIRQALVEAKEQKIGGNEVTPFLLQRVQQLTGGKSLAANIALIKNNAAVGAQIAVAHSQLTSGSCCS